MANVLVREIDERDLELLKRRAQASGRSLQAELKRILELAARASDEDAARALAEQRECRAGRTTASRQCRSDPQGSRSMKEKPRRVVCQTA